MYDAAAEFETNSCRIQHDESLEVINANQFTQQLVAANGAVARKQQQSVRTIAQTKMHRQGRHPGQMQGLREQNPFAASLRNGLTGAIAAVLANTASEAAWAIISVAAGSTAGDQAVLQAAKTCMMERSGAKGQESCK